MDNMQTVSMRVGNSPPVRMRASTDTESIKMNVESLRPIPVSDNNYENLINKPSINSVELVGDHSFEDLGDTPLTNIEIKEIFNRVFA